MTQYDDHLITDSGMGGYLDPPQYPTHTMSVGSGRKSHPSSLMSLPAAAQAEYVDPVIREKATQLLKAWDDNRPPLDSPEVQAWIADCKRHWANCWLSVEPDNYGCQCASLRSKHGPRQAGDVDYATYHIRHFYPEYQE